MAKVIHNKQFRLNYRDILKALLIAMLTPVFVVIQSSLDAGKFELNWKAIGIAAVSGGIAYLLKNFLTPSQTVVKADPDKIEIKPKEEQQ